MNLLAEEVRVTSAFTRVGGMFFSVGEGEKVVVLWGMKTKVEVNNADPDIVK